VLVHSWVVTVGREPVNESWGKILAEGVQLPWLSVLARTSSFGYNGERLWLLAGAILVVTGLVCWGIWQTGARIERRAGTLEG